MGKMKSPASDGADRLPDYLRAYVDGLYLRNTTRIEAYCHRRARGRDREEREENGRDLAHTVWMAACETLARWSPGEPLPTNPDAWLLGIARNIVNQYLRELYNRRRDDPLGYDLRDTRTGAPVDPYEIPDRGAEQDAGQAACRERIRRVWCLLNVRHRLALYKSFPEEVREVFPDEVAGLEERAGACIWNRNALYKALHDARVQAASPMGA